MRWRFPSGLFSVVPLSLFVNFDVIRSIDSKGALTTFIGVAALAFSQSAAFRIFFKMLVGIIVIALAHGVILTPALLGECSFVYSGIGHRDDSASPSAVTDEGVKESVDGDSVGTTTNSA